MSEPVPVSSPWPYVVALGVAVAGLLGAFAILTFAPSAATDHAIGKIGAAVTLIVSDPTGAAAAVVGIASFIGIAWAGIKAALHTPAPTRPSVPVRVPPSSRESGFADVRVIGYVAGAAAFALAGAALLSGCGASALATQGRAATIVGIGLGGAGQVIHDERAAALDACHDTDCEASTTSAWAPVLAAYESARAALTTWVEALDVARAAGADDGDVLGALLVAVSRLAAEWNALAGALRGVGVPLPDLPPSVVALLAMVPGASS